MLFKKKKVNKEKGYGMPPIRPLTKEDIKKHHLEKKIKKKDNLKWIDEIEEVNAMLDDIL